MFLLRHGERLDESNRELWASIRTPNNHHDPPLTNNGKVQAKTAGLALKTQLRRRSIAVEDTLLFVSPALRTLGTAASAGRVLGSKELIITPGAFQCAAAARRAGLKGLRMSGQEDKSFIDMIEDFPVSDRVHGGLTDTYSSALNSILDSLKGSQSVPIVVTHREGIRTTLKKANSVHVKLPYCVCVEFIRSSDMSWRFVDAILPLGTKTANKTNTRPLCVKTRAREPSAGVPRV